jgi:MarR family 2-MHQ and catechol resistance regulon transcriptional repressor
MIKHMSGAHLYLVLWKAFRAVEKLDQQSIADQGFSCTSDFAVLEVLYHKGSLPVKEIGEKVLLTSGSITTAIQRLEQKGWLRKEAHPQDSRSIIVSLTDTGPGYHCGSLCHTCRTIGRSFQ